MAASVARSGSKRKHLACRKSGLQDRRVEIEWRHRDHLAVAKLPDCQAWLALDSLAGGARGRGREVFDDKRLAVLAAAKHAAAFDLHVLPGIDDPTIEIGIACRAGERSTIGQTCGFFD